MVSVFLFFFFLWSWVPFLCHRVIWNIISLHWISILIRGWAVVREMTWGFHLSFTLLYRGALNDGPYSFSVHLCRYDPLHTIVGLPGPVSLTHKPLCLDSSLFPKVSDNGDCGGCLSLIFVESVHIFIRKLCSGVLGLVILPPRFFISPRDSNVRITSSDHLRTPIKKKINTEFQVEVTTSGKYIKI